MTEEKTIPYIAHESEVARLERVIKRLWILCIIIFICLIGTNAFWLWKESQYEDVEITQDVVQDSGDGGTNTYSGNLVGGDYYGEAENSNDNKNTPKKNW